MTQTGRYFSLSVEPGRGVFCGYDGLFVGGVPLLERRRNSSGADEWQPRPAADLNRELQKHYGVPVEFERKMGGLGAICRALNRSDLIHAQIATLHLQIPRAARLHESSSNSGQSDRSSARITNQRSPETKLGFTKASALAGGKSR
jgi:hypothetical protein